MFEISAEKGPISRHLQLGLQGSAVLFTYRDRYFSAFTRHQIASIPNETPKDFRERMKLLFVLMDDGKDTSNIPFNRCLFANKTSEDDENDYVIGLVECEMLQPYSREQFFPVSRHDRGRSGDFALAAGFPTHLQRVLMEHDGLHINPVCKSGALESRRAFGVMKYPRDSEPLDGMSGGAVFIPRLSEGAQTFEVSLDGIIQRGGNGYIRYLGIETVLDRIDIHLAG